MKKYPFLKGFTQLCVMFGLSYWLYAFSLIHPTTHLPSAHRQVGRTPCDSTSLSEIRAEIVEDIINKEYEYLQYCTKDSFLLYVSGCTKANGFLGLANNVGDILLDPIYEQLYNPDVSLVDCIEIKQEGKIGVFNYRTRQMIAPRFQYIIPEAFPATNVAWGIDDGVWYKIVSSSNGVSVKPDAQYSPIATLQQLKLDVFTLPRSQILTYIDKQWSLKSYFGRMVLPSYLAYIDDLKAHYPHHDECEYLFLPEYNGFRDMEKLRSASKSFHKINDKITAFVQSMFLEGSSGRGYSWDYYSLVTHNAETQAINTHYIGNFDHFLTDSAGICQTFTYQFLNDSIFEVQYTDRPYEQKYKVSSNYKYINIQPDGGIQELKTHRRYPYTKFAKMEDRYFSGCFLQDLPQEMYHMQNWGYTYWRTTHLSIEDLDTMRNEIYADYGYRFQAPAWRQYFSRFKWYSPAYDNVDSLLTPIDKYNLGVILKEKNRMIYNNERNLPKYKHNYYTP